MGPKAGDYVEYEGVVRRVMCGCSDPGADHFREASNRGTLEFFDQGEYADTCPECKDYFWFDKRIQHLVYTLKPRYTNYEGVGRKVMCGCNDPDGSLRDCVLVRGPGTFFSKGDYARECPECGEYFWFDRSKQYAGLSEDDNVTAPCPEHATDDNPLASLRDVLPDVYGRREHAAYMARQAEMQQRQAHESKYAALELLGDIMDKVCGPARVDEPEEEPGPGRFTNESPYPTLIQSPCMATLDQNKRSFWGCVAS
jgi:hypothetical protein